MSSGGEISFINDLRRRFPASDGRGMALGMGDDCALLRVRAGWRVAVTTDLLVEGRHFRRETHVAESAGHRCLARGLSDLAAMGAAPLAAFLSLGLAPGDLAGASGRRWVGGFLRGLRALALRAGVPLAGGDTAESAGGLLVADIVLVGTAPRGEAMRRSSARAGDLLYVTGHLGGAAAELEMMFQGAVRAAARSRGPQRFPEPRLGAGLALRKLGVRAAIDVSDGLSTDLRHLADASGVSAMVEAESLPLHALLRGKPSEDSLRLALHGGEDYELLFAAPPRLRIPEKIGDVKITRIGTLQAGSSRRARVNLMTSDGRVKPLPAQGWQHFARNSGPSRGSKP